MMSKPFSLSKNERLKSKKQIDALFLTGEAFFVFPYKVKYCFKATDNSITELKFAVSVPKKNFKKAVDRNRLKRLSREAYRLHKAVLEDALTINQKSFNAMFIYTHNELLTYTEVEKAMIKCIEKIRSLC